MPRMRMFAGPNGSGKSTIKDEINQKLLGIYINPDEMEYAIQRSGFLDLKSYQVQTTHEEVLGFFKRAELLQQEDLISEVAGLHFEDGMVIFKDVRVNSYFASVIADFIRTKLLECRISFSFETVMSHPGKVELLKHAQAMGLSHISLLHCY